MLFIFGYKFISGSPHFADVIPSSFSSLINAFDANWGPRSEMILSGSPNLLYIFLNRSWAVPSAVIVLLHGGENYPLSKSLVYHDQYRVESLG